jgi:RimJ/RimL family protein N-acetyltransferase
MDPRRVTLEGATVRLEPLAAEHLDGLAEIGLDASIWRWMQTLITERDQLRGWIGEALATDDAGSTVSFATIERSTGRAVGSSRYLNIERQHRRLEIGYTWVAPAWQRTSVNREAKLLMVGHAIETLGAHRVEFKTDALNVASRAALAGIGAVEEGTFRRHMVVQGGRLRDSAYFSIVDTEWPETKAALQAKLEVVRTPR